MSSGLTDLPSELLMDNFHIYHNLFMCSKNLYNYSTLSYIKKCYILDINLPIVNFMICPSDGYGSVLNNIALYIIISHNTKEYMLCTLKQLIPLLYGMNTRWKLVIVHPYTGSECLIYYGICGYNFALIDYHEQSDNSKYVCDVSLLKNHKYSKNELFKIANILGLQIPKNVSRCKLQNLIYSTL
jgi:hypothetical protein